MKLHNLKIKDIYFNDILFGGKTFEIRKDDRDYAIDDLIQFSVIRKNGTTYDFNLVFRITYILRDVPEYGLLNGYVILGIKRLEEK